MLLTHNMCNIAYCLGADAQQLGVPLNAMPIMDNCSAHLHYLSSLPHVDYFSSTSIIQPLYQEFIGNFKSFNQKYVYEDPRLKTKCGTEIHQIILKGNEENQDADVDVGDPPPLEVDKTSPYLLHLHLGVRTCNELGVYWLLYSINRRRAHGQSYTRCCRHYSSKKSSFKYAR